MSAPLPGAPQSAAALGWPAKILAVAVIAVATAGLPQESSAHRAYAAFDETHRPFFWAAPRQNGLIQISWVNIGITAATHGVNWCKAKTPKPVPDLYVPVNNDSFELNTNNFCAEDPQYSSLGVDIATNKGSNVLRWDLTAMPPATTYVIVINTYSEQTQHDAAPHSHSLRFVTVFGPNRAGGYGGPTDVSRNQSRSFQENPAPNTTIGRHVRAYSDPDGDAQYYTLAGDDASKFTIGLRDGIIRTKDRVYDYDANGAQRTFHVTVQVADRKNHLGETDTRIDDTASVAISLTNYTGRELPSALSIETGPADKKIRISWNKYTQEKNKPPFTKYEARIKEGSRFLPTKVITDINTTQYTHTGLTNGTRYAVWAEACNHEGCGGNPVNFRHAVTPSVAGVTVDPVGLVVREGGNATYTLALANQPTAAVVFAITRSNNADTDLTASPSQLTFTPSNWNTAQTVTVSAAADDDDVGNGQAIFSHTATSSDGDYNGIAVNGVTATEVDDDILFNQRTFGNQTFPVNVPITPLTLPRGIGSIRGRLSYTLEPALPAGLSFNGNTRVLSGVPTTVAAATYTYTAADASDDTSNPVLSFVIAVQLPQPGGALSVSPSGGDRTVGDVLNLSGVTVPASVGTASIVYDWWRSTDDGTLEPSDLRVESSSPTYTVVDADGGYWLFGRARLQSGSAFTPDADAAVLTFRAYPPAGVGALSFVGVPRVGGGLQVVLSGGMARAGHNTVVGYYSGVSSDPATDIDTLVSLGRSEKPSAAAVTFPCCRGDSSTNANPLNSGDVGRFIYLRLRYKGPNGLQTRDEEAPVAAISSARVLTDASPTVNAISGRLATGNILIANTSGTAPLGHEHAYQWYRHSSASDTSSTTIDGANEMAYLLREADLDRHISVGVRYRLADGVRNQTTEVRSAISANAVVVGAVRLRLRVFLEGPLR